MEQLLVWDAVSYSDGGGVAVAAPNPVSGRERVAKFAVGVLTKAWSGAAFDAVDANGRAAVLVTRDGELLGLLTIGASVDGIDRAFWVVNPNKVVGVARSAH